MAREIRIDRGTPLDACEGKGAAVVWPLPLDAHVDDLVGFVEAVHERTSRKELVAAIVFAAPADGKRLAKILRDYRAATVGDLAPASDIGEDVAVFERHRPGPRRKAQ